MTGLSRSAAIVFVALAGAACTGAATSRTETAPQPSGTANAELEAIYRARIDSARSRFSEADVRFMTGMIVHHTQALVMAELAPTHGASSSLQTLAARIINAQKDEIASMRQWLLDRGQEVPEVQIRGTTMVVRSAKPGLHMAGMLTPEQMQELDEAWGEEFERLFLTYMIQHHRGAVTMVLDLFATDGAAQEDGVFKLASDIQADQASEIARMELMLEALTEARRDS